MVHWMKSLRFHRFGDLSNLEIMDLPIPTPAPGEVLVRVLASAINPSDAKNILGKMEGTTLPRTPGRDFAGVVELAPSHLAGKYVYGCGGDIGFTRDGSHAEYIVVPERGIASMPSNLSMTEAATLGVNFVTAYSGVVEAAGLQRGEVIVISGATGGVGTASMQLARFIGATIITIGRTPPGKEWIERNGVSLALSTSQDDIAERVREFTGGAGADVAMDCVGGEVFEICLSTLGQLGRQIVMTSVGPRRASFDLLDFYHRRLLLRGIDSRALDTVACAVMLDKLRTSFESGDLRTPRIAKTYRLEEAREAYGKVIDGSAGGKIVFDLA